MSDIPELHGNPNDFNFNPEFVFKLKEELVEKDKVILELATALKEASKELNGASECIKSFTSKVATTSGYEVFVSRYRALAEKHL